MYNKIKKYSKLFYLRFFALFLYSVFLIKLFSTAIISSAFAATGKTDRQILKHFNTFLKHIKKADNMSEEEFKKNFTREKTLFDSAERFFDPNSDLFVEETMKNLDEKFIHIIDKVYSKRLDPGDAFNSWVTEFTRVSNELDETYKPSRKDMLDFYIRRISYFKPEIREDIRRQSEIYRNELEQKISSQAPVSAEEIESTASDTKNKTSVTQNSKIGASNSSSDPALSGDFSTLKWIWEIMASYPITTATISLTVVGGGLAIAYYYWWPKNSDSSSKSSSTIEKDKLSSSSVSTEKENESDVENHQSTDGFDDEDF